MKSFILFFAGLLICSVSLAQDQFFVHTATAATISADASFIDHPDLNGNPSAQILITHNWNPPGSVGVYNDNNTGAFYSVGDAQWAVYNESGAAMVEDSSYNIYIGDGTDVFLHIADAGAVGVDPSYTVLDHPDLNNNPGAQIIVTTYYNPNSLRNDETYAVWYDNTLQRWIIFTESLDPITLDTAFFVGIEGGVTASATHIATAGNITGNYTVISHPLLDGDPDARFALTHNWGESGDTSNVLNEHITGVWYTGTNWAIFNEDIAAMPVNMEFNLKIYDAALSAPDTVIEGLSFYPNPTNGMVTISGNSLITQATVVNILGQEIMTVKGQSNTLQLDLSSYPSGHYFAKVQSGEATQTIKLIRQ